jgi:hypothetical protein
VAEEVGRVSVESGVDSWTFYSKFRMILVAADAYELKTLEFVRSLIPESPNGTFFSTNWPFHKKKKKKGGGLGGGHVVTLDPRVGFRSCSWQFVSLIHPLGNPFERFRWSETNQTNDEMIWNKKDGGKHVVSTVCIVSWGGEGIGEAGVGVCDFKSPKVALPPTSGDNLSRTCTFKVQDGLVGGPKRSRDQTPLMWSSQYVWFNFQPLLWFVKN